MNHPISHPTRDERRDDDEPTWPEPSPLDSGQARRAWADGASAALAEWSHCR